jgi:hypothetical protein
MMRHLLMDPAFPDIVGEWAAEEAKEQAGCCASANDNYLRDEDGVSDPLLSMIATLEVAATRLW